MKTITDAEAQNVLNRVREALDTPDLANPFQRLVAVGMALKALDPITSSDIQQAEEIATATRL